MNDTYTEPTAAELLSMEVQARRNHILNSIHTRKHHPSYGVTKSALTAELHNLEGLLYALSTVLFGNRSAAFGLQAVEMADVLGWSLGDLAAAVKAA